MLLPFAVADYVDFYASEHHATRVGRILRPGGGGWRPTGAPCQSAITAARARSSSPAPGPAAIGQLPPVATAAPVAGPTRRLDFEAEIGYVVGTPSAPGEPVPVDAFPDHVFGICLLNDWSARDVQGWESRPLGPFLGKSFATSISPWIVPLPRWRRRDEQCLRAHRVAVPGGVLAMGSRSRGRGAGRRPIGLPAAVHRNALEPGPNAGAPDPRRRTAAHRRPLRVRHS